MDNPRRTSAAKDALSQRADNALERYGITTGAFNQAREDDPSISHQVNAQMVKNDRPSNDMRPPPDIARPVDRESFDERWRQEQERAGDFERGEDHER